MGLISIRRRLLLLVAVAVVPLAVLAAIGLVMLFDHEHQRAEEPSAALARALASAVDTELRLTIAALQTLAASEPLASTSATASDGDTLDPLWQRVLAARPEWSALLLAEPSGAVVSSSATPLLDAPPSIVDRDSFAAALRSGAPTIGALTRGPHGDAGIPVRVPIFRDGEPRYVLTAIVKPDAIDTVVVGARVAADHVAAVFDAKGTRVAGSRRDPHDRVESPPLALPMRRGSEGAAPTGAAPATRVATALAHLDTASGWTVTVVAPAALAASGLRNAAAAYGAGVVLSLALGTLAALALARRIARPLVSSHDAADVDGDVDAATGAGEDGRREAIAARNDSAAGAAVAANDDADTTTALDLDAADAALAAPARVAPGPRNTTERAHEHLQILADISDALLRSLDERTTLDAIGAALVPVLVDCCRIDLLDDAGTLRPVLMQHRDPERQPGLAELVETLRPAPSAAGSMGRAVATGEMQVAQFEHAGDYGDVLADVDVLAFAAAVGLRGLCIVPLVAHGRTIGALAAIQAESARLFSADDCALLLELAQRSALALDNARRYAAAATASARAERAKRANDELLTMLEDERSHTLASAAATFQPAGRDARDREEDRDGAAGSGQPEPAQDAEPPWRDEGELALLDLVGLGDDRRDTDLVGPGDDRTGADLVDSGNDRPGTDLVHPGNDRPGTDLVDPGNDRPGTDLVGPGNDRPGADLVGPGNDRPGTDLVGQGDDRAETAAPPEPTASTVAPGSASPAPGPARATGRILIVEANAEIADSLSLLLELDGHDVRTAASVEATLALLDRFVPQVALLDIETPALDGHELAVALRADPRTAAARLIALAGEQQASDPGRALDAGFDAHLVAPIDLDRLLETIEALLSAAATTAAASAAGGSGGR